MNKKLIWSVIVAIIAIVLITGVSNNKSVTDNGRIRIGVIVPLSGPAAAFGLPTQRAVDLAMSHLSDDVRSKIEIVYGDDQLDTKQTVSVTQKLIDTDKVSAIVAWSSPTAVAASYVAERSGIPMVGLGNSPEINTNKQWVLRYMLGPVPQARAIVDLLLKGKYKKVAIMWNQSDGPKSVHDELVKILPAEGFTVVADESVMKGENDFKTSISKLRAAKPEVVIAYISPQVGIFAKQAKDLRLDTPLVSGPPFEIIEQVKAAQGGIDNQLFVGADNIAFMDEFYAKYSSYPTIAGDYMADAITQLATALSSGQTGQDLVRSIKKDFSGVAGAYKYNGDGSFDVKQVVKKWDGIKFVVVN